jgi:hypothetical protein
MERTCVPIDQVILNGIDLERFPWRARHDEAAAFDLVWADCA